MPQTLFFFLVLEFPLTQKFYFVNAPQFVDILFFDFLVLLFLGAEQGFRFSFDFVFVFCFTSLEGLYDAIYIQASFPYWLSDSPLRSYDISVTVLLTEFSRWLIYVLFLSHLTVILLNLFFLDFVL